MYAELFTPSHSSRGAKTLSRSKLFKTSLLSEPYTPGALAWAGDACRPSCLRWHRDKF